MAGTLHHEACQQGWHSCSLGCVGCRCSPCSGWTTIVGIALHPAAWEAPQSIPAVAKFRFAAVAVGCRLRHDMEAQSAALRSAVESQGREVAALRATAAAAETESAAAKAELAQVGIEVD
jgi:hypothetical protein